MKTRAPHNCFAVSSTRASLTVQRLLRALRKTAVQSLITETAAEGYTWSGGDFGRSRSSTLHVILRDFEPTPTLQVNEPIAENTA
jgi:hypothetical protein